MLLKPKTLENIIVGVRWNNIFNWYVTKRDIWFMDINKMDGVYDGEGADHEVFLLDSDSNIAEDERYGIPVLNEDTADIFILRIRKYVTDTIELRELLKSSILPKSKEEVFYDFLPSLLVDFDKRTLYSMYTEPISFEDYVPDEWEGLYTDFLCIVEPQERFWVEKNIFVYDFSKGDGHDE